MKKFLCVILAVFMMLPFAVSCANDTGDNGDDTTVSTTPVAEINETTAPVSEETTEAKVEANLLNTRYDGYEFVVGNDFADSSKYTTNAITATEQNGEPINDAIYVRTVDIEQKYGIKIVDMDVDLTPIKNTIQAGEDAYAIITVDLSNVKSIFTAGYALDFNDIENIDLDKPWWDQNARQKLNFEGKLYYMFSDFLITALDNARATYFNKDLITVLNLENPYELVNSGKWTYTKFAEMAKAAVSDLDGDGKYTTTDRVGIANNATTFYEVMLTGCDAEIAKQGDDGVPYFFCYSDQDKFINIYQSLLKAFTTDNQYLVTNTDDGRSMFYAGNSLFTTDTLYLAKLARQQEVNFGILPVAKWDEAQERYWEVSPNPHAMMIPSTTKDTARTGAILEALSYYSSTHYSDTALIPAYYETALKYKSSTDNESAEMLDIIHDNISYVNKFAGTDLTNAIFKQFEAANMNIASVLKTLQKPQQKVMNDTIEKMRNLAGN